MNDWQNSLNSFLEEWKNKDEVIGALVCGSFITGNPSKHSDIDLHIILKSGTNWRERGNKYVDGYLIEYFANPPEQIRKYFKEDYEDGTQMAVVQFLTGKTIFEDGIVTKLKKEAEEYFNKAFVKLPSFKIELNKYGLWDTLDNLEDAFEEKKPHFMFIYHVAINQLIQFYCKYLGYPVIKFNKAYEILTSDQTRGKYLLKEFPDTKFKDLLIPALLENNPIEAMRLYKEIVEHLMNVFGGFVIDGWKFKSPVDV